MSVLKLAMTADQAAANNNNGAMQASIDALNDTLVSIRAGGDAKAIKRTRALGKMMVRERIDQLIDVGATFLELSALAGFDLYDFPTPAGGIVCGIAPVSGVLCMIIANDPTVKGGAYFPITLKKHLRAQAIAEQCHLPCIYLVDSAGAFLPMQDEVFPDRDDFGRLFFNQARLSAKGIAQIAVVLGLCTAGGAYVPAMADECIMVKDVATIFLGGPPLVEAATGEKVDAQDLGGADVHCQHSGVADYKADNEAHALAITRRLVANTRQQMRGASQVSDFDPPLYGSDYLLSIIPADKKQSFDVRDIIACIVDGSEFDEFKELFAQTLVCGFARISGHLIGIVANNGILFSESAQKAAHFIQLCDKRNIPLLFLQNISGFMVGQQYEANGIAKHGAKMVNAVACAKVPKFTVVIGSSHGAGNYAMCGRAYDPTFMWMWPNAKISVMGGTQAATVLANVKQAQAQRRGEEFTDKQRQQLVDSIYESYDRTSHAFYASARCWDDGVIDPRDTRYVLSLALSMTANQEQGVASYGVFRM